MHVRGVWLHPGNFGVEKTAEGVLPRGVTHPRRDKAAANDEAQAGVLATEETYDRKGAEGLAQVAERNAGNLQGARFFDGGLQVGERLAKGVVGQLPARK